jgi:hypothetical protein
MESRLFILEQQGSLRFRVPTWPLYSSSILGHSCSSNSAYVLDQYSTWFPLDLRTYSTKYSSAPLFLKFCIPTWPNCSRAPSFRQILRSYSTIYSSSTPLDVTISTYLLDKNIQVHPRFLHFYMGDADQRIHPRYFIRLSPYDFIAMYGMLCSTNRDWWELARRDNGSKWKACFVVSSASCRKRNASELLSTPATRQHWSCSGVGLD